MTQWMVLYRKEINEMVRNYKIIWVPLVFILLGVMQPVSAYYMPQILDEFGGLPEGAIIDIPLPSGGEVLIQVLSNYGMLGVLILVLSSMGIVSVERQSGVAAMVMMKPVPHSSYILSKWAGLMTITFTALFIGYAAAWYYTNLLIESVAVERVIQSIVIYSVWLCFVLTLTLFLSTLMKSNGSVAFMTILIIMLLSMATSFFENKMKWSPATMTGHSGNVLQFGELEASFLPGTLITLVMVVIILILTIQVFKQKELLD